MTNGFKVMGMPAAAFGTPAKNVAFIVSQATKNKMTKPCHKKCCDLPKSIPLCAFKDPDTGTLSKTYKIEQPGNYLLCCSVDFVPIVDGQCAIQILSDDVTLDLGANVLQQATTLPTVPPPPSH